MSDAPALEHRVGLRLRLTPTYGSPSPSRRLRLLRCVGRTERSDVRRPRSSTASAFACGSRRPTGRHRHPDVSGCSDAYIVRRRTLNLSKRYDENGPYRGVDCAGVVASLVGAGVALSFPAVSWYASLVPAGLTYWLLMNHWQACRRFCEN